MSDDEKYLDPETNPMIKTNGDLDGVDTDGLAPMKRYDLTAEILEKKLNSTPFTMVDLGQTYLIKMTAGNWRTGDGRNLGDLSEDEIRVALDDLEEK